MLNKIERKRVDDWIWKKTNIQCIELTPIFDEIQAVVAYVDSVFVESWRKNRFRSQRQRGLSMTKVTNGNYFEVKTRAFLLHTRFSLTISYLRKIWIWYNDDLFMLFESNTHAHRLICLSFFTSDLAYTWACFVDIMLSRRFDTSEGGETRITFLSRTNKQNLGELEQWMNGENIERFLFLSYLKQKYWKAIQTLDHVRICRCLREKGFLVE